MATKKRLIDKDALIERCDAPHWCVWMSEIEDFPTVDAVEVVFCDECENHGNCYPETIFRLARIEKPFCCVGKRKTNTNCGAKMDGGKDND